MSYICEFLHWLNLLMIWNLMKSLFFLQERRTRNEWSSLPVQLKQVRSIPSMSITIKFRLYCFKYEFKQANNRKSVCDYVGVTVGRLLSKIAKRFQCDVFNQQKQKQRSKQQTTRNKLKWVHVLIHRLSSICTSSGQSLSTQRRPPQKSIASVF